MASHDENAVVSPVAIHVSLCTTVADHLSSSLYREKLRAWPTYCYPQKGISCQP